jgi:hypothetical protein
MPLFSILAARTLMVAVRALEERTGPLGARIAGPALALLSLAPGLLGIAASHPDGIGFYNELAGGIRGGAELGMQRSFWGGVSRPLMKDVAALQPGTRVFFDHTNWDAVAMYQREGVIGPVSFSNGPEQSQAATVFEHREGYPSSEDAVWSSVGTRPTDGVYVDNVTFVQFYSRQGNGR